MLAGIILGLLMGAVSGTVFLLLLKSANHPSTPVVKVMSLTTELLAIPTFWFGGPWLSTDILKLVDRKEMLNPYLAALAACFFLFSAYPASRWILSLAKDLGSTGGKQ